MPIWEHDKTCSHSDQRNIAVQMAYSATMNHIEDCLTWHRARSFSDAPMSYFYFRALALLGSQWMILARFEEGEEEHVAGSDIL